MNLRPHHLLFPAAVALLSTSSFAQRELTVDQPASDVDVEPSDAAPLFGRVAGRELLEHVHYNTAADGTVWALGDAYKASFDARGFTYIPYLGARAPRNFPVEFALERATVGGADLAFDAHAAPMRATDRVVYERGTLREVYDLTTTSVEQSFVFDTLPASGEIALRLNVASSMQRGEHAQRLSFSNEHGRVEYSRAVAIDAAGTRTELPTRFDGDDIEIRVPAEVAARAVLPLVVDPVLQTYAVDNSYNFNFDPDIAFDSARQLTVAVYEQPFSAVDTDIVVNAHTLNGTLVQIAYVDVSSADWRAPRLAFNHRSDQFLVVAQVGLAGSTQIRGRTVVTYGPVIGAPIDISGGESGSHVAPDVGGDAATDATSAFCVVWQLDDGSHDSDIRARVLDPNGGFVGSPIDVTDVPNLRQIHPAISNAANDAANSGRGWNVVYEEEKTPTDHDIFGSQIGVDGSLTVARFVIDNSTRDDRWPSVSTSLPVVGWTNLYATVFERYSVPGDQDIRMVSLDGPVVIASANLSGFEPVHARNQIRPSIDCDGSQFVIAYAEESAGAGSAYRNHVSQYAWADGVIVPSEMHEQMSAGAFTDSPPRVCARRSTGGTGRIVSAVWQITDALGNTDILGSDYQGVTGGPISGYCAGNASGACPCGAGGPDRGCPNSANALGAALNASGTAAVTNDGLVLQTTSAPVNSSCLYFQGTAQLAPALFGDGLRCVGGSVIRLGVKTNAGGSSSYPVPGDAFVSVRGAVPSNGGVRYYQAWYRNAAAFCTASTFNLTNALRVVWTH